MMEKINDIQKIERRNLKCHLCEMLNLLSEKELEKSQWVITFVTLNACGSPNVAKKYLKFASYIAGYLLCEVESPRTDFFEKSSHSICFSIPYVEPYLFLFGRLHK